MYNNDVTEENLKTCIGICFDKKIFKLKNLMRYGQILTTGWSLDLLITPI